jgi:hypothetical protein
VLPDTAPISLYLDLAVGKKADLEIVSHAALAFAGAIREAAYIIDPSLKLRIELISGTESSLSLNSLIKSVNPKDIISKRNLLTLASVALIWFRHETLVWSYQEFLNLLKSDPGATHLSVDDTEAIAQRAADIIEKGLAAKQVESVYRALETDPAIQGVGATSKPGERPTSIVPRTEFRARSGESTTLQLEVTKRVKTETETLTLVRPVLLPSQYQRRWGFRGKEGEFGATVRDTSFIDNLVEGRTAVPLVSGIRLIVELQTTEELKDHVWQTVDRTITKVMKIIPPQIQTGLESPPSSHPPKPPYSSGGKHS